MFDDGAKVYIQFPSGLAQSEAPPLFVIGPDAKPALVNYRVRGTTYIVDRLFAAAELRLGTAPQRVVRIVRTDGERMRFGNCVRRLIGYWVSAILFLGFLWVLVDNRRQGFHDKIAGTFVVYAWPEVGPPVTPARDRLRDLRQRRQMARSQD